MSKKVRKFKPASDQRAMARQKHLRISPFKARRVADIIRNKKVIDAFKVLQYTPTKAARMFNIILKSAVANAENNHNMDTDKLYVETCTVNEGSTWKRIMPRAQGRASRIRKRTSHFMIVLAEYMERKQTATKKAENKNETKNEVKNAENTEAKTSSNSKED